MTFRVAYCLNGWRWLWRQLLTSMITMGRFIPKEKIVCFYGPPRFKEHIDWLEKRCDLRLVDEVPLHDEESLSRRKIFKGKFWGSLMMIYSYSLDTPELFRIDADTIIHGNPKEILDIGRRENYDVMISRWLGYTPGGYKTLCESEGLMAKELRMPGFTIFRNHAHNRFLRYYIPYLNRIFEGELKTPNPNRLEIYAFNLSLLKLEEEGYRVFIMPDDWHQYAGGRYVQHLARKEIATWMEPKIFSEEEYRIRDIGEEETSW